VRIMKSRQRLSHTHLIGEVIEQVKERFSPDVVLVKKMIEHLIDKGFIARQGDGYVYVS
jgi:predicted transcriptional regulator